MKRFIDEEGKIWTSDQLKADFDELVNDGIFESDYTFEDYITDCTDKDGALTEITRAYAERKIREAFDAWQDTKKNYDEGYANLDDYMYSLDKLGEAINLNRLLKTK